MPKVQMERLTVGDIDENCYLAVNSETNELLVIDPGAEAERILRRHRRTQAPGGAADPRAFRPHRRGGRGLRKVRHSRLHP